MAVRALSSRLWSRGRIALLAAVLVIGLATAGTAVAARSQFKHFGNATAVARGGDYLSPDVKVSSTSFKDPSRVRYVVVNKAPGARQMRIYWDLSCWRRTQWGNDYVKNAYGSYDVTIRKGKQHVQTKRAPSNADFCSMDVWASYTNNSLGSYGRIAVYLLSR